MSHAALPFFDNHHRGFQICLARDAKCADYRRNGLEIFSARLLTAGSFATFGDYDAQNEGIEANNGNKLKATADVRDRDSDRALITRCRQPVCFKPNG